MDGRPWHVRRIVGAVAECYDGAMSLAPSSAQHAAPRHAAAVRITHWLTVAAFLALLVSGVEIVLSHPRFYWGETGNVGMPALFTLPVPSSRATVPTGFGYVLPDQNGWSRYLHFQAAWLVVLAGLVYGAFGAWSGHFRANLLPAAADRTWRALREALATHLAFARPVSRETEAYNVLQRLAYLSVVFGLFPLVIWTGLAMSPAFTSALPASVTLLGGRQSARTLHFVVSGALLLFFIVHVVMVALAGFTSRTHAMITGAAGRVS